MRDELVIREERPGEVAAIHTLNVQAFGQPQEADLVDALRRNDGVLLSLVAERNHALVGHILYSPVSVVSHGESVMGAGLGPMAVAPTLQRTGIGSKLVEAGNARIRQQGHPFIILVGHPAYYPRFGFRPAKDYGFRCQWDVPDEAFMALILDEARMKGVAGLVQYREEFSVFA